MEKVFLFFSPFDNLLSTEKAKVSICYLKAPITDATIQAVALMLDSVLSTPQTCWVLFHFSTKTEGWL